MMAHPTNLLILYMAPLGTTHIQACTCIRTRMCDSLCVLCDPPFLGGADGANSLSR
jgi:hypothetical protein